MPSMTPHVYISIAGTYFMLCCSLDNMQQLVFRVKSDGFCRAATNGNQGFHVMLHASTAVGCSSAYGVTAHTESAPDLRECASRMTTGKMMPHVTALIQPCTCTAESGVNVEEYSIDPTQPL